MSEWVECCVIGPCTTSQHHACLDVAKIFNLRIFLQGFRCGNSNHIQYIFKVNHCFSFQLFWLAHKHLPKKERAEGPHSVAWVSWKVWREIPQKCHKESKVQRLYLYTRGKASNHFFSVGLTVCSVVGFDGSAKKVILFVQILLFLFAFIWWLQWKLTVESKAAFF